MSFEAFLNQPSSEPHLLSRLTYHVQANYLTHQDRCFFLKLAKAGERKSKIVWVKAFLDEYELGDFFYDTVMQRACIMLKFHESHYEILCLGHFFSDRYNIFPDCIRGSHPDENSGDIEEHKMYSRELLEKGFGEITTALKATKRNKAM